MPVFLSGSLLLTGSLTLNQNIAPSTNSPILIVTGSVSASSNLAQGANYTPNLVAAANNDVLVGLDINPTFSTGSFTVAGNWGLRTNNINVRSSTLPLIYSLRINGTISSPTAVLNGDELGRLTFAGQWGSSREHFNTSAYIRGVASENFNVTNNGSILSFFNTTNGAATAIERLRIFNTGNILIQNGGTFTDAGFRLDVSGSTRITNNLTISGSTEVTGSQRITGSLSVSQGITGSSILSTGQITAQTLVVSTISSSVTFSSGSNIFGNSTANTQTMTGSVNITGSLTVTTAGTSPEFQVAVGGTTIGNALTDIHQVTGSLRITGSSDNFILGCNLSIGQTTSALQSAGTGLTIYGATNSEVKFLNSTTGQATTDGTALVANGNNFTINNREAGFINLGTSNTTRATIASTGEACFSCQVCAGGRVSAINSGVDGTFQDAFVGIYSGNSNEQNAIQTSVSSIAANSGFLFMVSCGAGLSTRSCGYRMVRSGHTFYTSNTPRFIIDDSGISCFSNTVCAPTINMGGTGARKFTLYTDAVSGTCNSSGFGVDLDGASYGAGAFFAYGNSDDGRFVIGSLQNTTFRSKFTIFGSGIGCFASTVCAPTFRGGSSLQLGGYAFQFTAAKNFNENTSDVEFFKIAMGGGQAAIFVNFSSFNYGTAAYKVQTYHGLLSNNWTGWVGCGIEVTGNPSCRANFAASSINSIATYSGCLVFRVSTTNNGTSTQATGTAFITVVTDGTVPTFTQL